MLTGVAYFVYKNKWEKAVQEHPGPPWQQEQTKLMRKKSVCTTLEDAGKQGD